MPHREHEHKHKHRGSPDHHRHRHRHHEDPERARQRHAHEARHESPERRRRHESPHTDPDTDTGTDEPRSYYPNASNQLLKFIKFLETVIENKSIDEDQAEQYRRDFRTRTFHSNVDEFAGDQELQDEFNTFHETIQLMQRQNAERHDKSRPRNYKIWTRARADADDYLEVANELQQVLRHKPSKLARETFQRHSINLTDTFLATNIRVKDSHDEDRHLMKLTNTILAQIEDSRVGGAHP